MKKYYLLLWGLLLCLQLPLRAYHTAYNDTYTVRQGETLYRIALMHQITVEALKMHNPQILGNSIKIGDVLQIPQPPTALKVQPADSSVLVLEAQSIVVSPKPTLVVKGQQQVVADKTTTPAATEQLSGITTKGSPPQVATPIEAVIISSLLDSVKKPLALTDTIPLDKLKPVKHIVLNGETLVSIGRTYNQTINNLKAWNKLSKLNLKPAQEIIIAWVLPSGEAALKPAKPAKPSLNDYAAQYAVMASDSLGTYRTGKGTGIATFFEDGGGTNLYCLHRTAPVQSIVRVTNPVNKRSVCLKVIGVLPNTVQNEDVEINITSSAAAKLNMRDSRTIVNWRYYTKR